MAFSAQKKLVLEPTLPIAFISSGAIMFVTALLGCFSLRSEKPQGLMCELDVPSVSTGSDGFDPTVFFVQVICSGSQ